MPAPTRTCFRIAVQHDAKRASPLTQRAIHYGNATRRAQLTRRFRYCPRNTSANATASTLPPVSVARKLWPFRLARSFLARARATAPTPSKSQNPEKFGGRATAICASCFTIGSGYAATIPTNRSQKKRRGVSDQGRHQNQSKRPNPASPAPLARLPLQALLTPPRDGAVGRRPIVSISEQAGSQSGAFWDAPRSIESVSAKTLIPKRSLGQLRR